MKVKEMNKQERPREKAIQKGVSALSNRDLLAILLRSGTKEKSVLELADQVLHSKQDLASLMELHLQDLIKIKGIKEAKAVQLLACFELCKRISMDQVRTGIHKNDDPQAICNWLIQLIGHEMQEHYIVIFLNAQGSMITFKDLFIGTSSKSFANPREIFTEALHYGASSMICAHNHPSGNVEPSKTDLRSARNIEYVGSMVGIVVMDHLIVSDRSYYSFRQHHLMIDQMYECKKKHKDQLLFPDL